MEYHTIQRCTFPPCTHSFPRLNHKKKYCSGCCRVKDFNRRKKLKEKASEFPAFREETLPSELKSAFLSVPPVISHPVENAQPEPKRGMSFAGVGESAIGTASMLFLKHQFIDKDHRAQLQQQMNLLLQQQELLAQQLMQIKQAILTKDKGDSVWDEELMM